MENFYPRNPTYEFSVGDEVKFGGFKNCQVLHVLDDANTYVLKCKTIDGEVFTRTANWTQVKTLPGTSNLTEGSDIRLSFSGSDVDGLLSTYYCSGVDMNPVYQRGNVWGIEDKVALIDSIFNNVDIGKFVFRHNNPLSEMAYEVIDGRQRLTALTEYYENRYPYKGYYYNNLSAKDRLTFRGAGCLIARVENLTDKDVYRLFIRLNTTGKVMDEKHIEFVKSLYEEAI